MCAVCSNYDDCHVTCQSARDTGVVAPKPMTSCFPAQQSAESTKDRIVGKRSETEMFLD